MANSIPKLFTAQEANGNSSSLKWEGGVGYLVGGGTFTAATIEVQYSPDGGTTWLATSETLNAIGMNRFDLPPGHIRVNQSSTAGDSIDAWVGKVHPVMV